MMLICMLISNTGNIGAELSFSNVGMFISSDAGNSWRKVPLHQESHQDLLCFTHYHTDTDITASSPQESVLSNR